MTEVEVTRDDHGEILSLTARGHAEQAPRGEDIVCASITTLFEVLSRSASVLPKGTVNITREDSSTTWAIQLEPGQHQDEAWGTYQQFLDSTVEVIRNISTQYPDFCSLRVIS